MAQHIGRKELKKDEIAETLAHGAEAVISHQRLVWIVGGAALAVVLVVVGWRFYTERQTVKAAAALEDAMQVFQARIRPVGEPEQPGEITYVDEKNKYEDAAKKFAQVAQKYSRTWPGQMARYYAGLSDERLGRYDEAQKWLQQVEAIGDAELAALARFQRAQVYEKTGKGEQAAKLYQQLIARPATLVPKPLALLALADHYRKNNPQEAAKLYNQIKSEFADTSLAEEAETRLQLLRPKT